MIQRLRERDAEAVISIDTIRGSVATQALAAGASIINDVSAGASFLNCFWVSCHFGSIGCWSVSWSAGTAWGIEGESTLPVAAVHGVPIVLSHNRCPNFLIVRAHLCFQGGAGNDVRKFAVRQRCGGGCGLPSGSDRGGFGCRRREIQSHCGSRFAVTCRSYAESGMLQESGLGKMVLSTCGFYAPSIPSLPPK